MSFPHKVPWLRLYVAFIGVLVIGATAWLLIRPRSTPVLVNPNTAANNAAAPQIHSFNDLTSAQRALDNNDPTTSNNTDISQLTDQANSF